ncbi:hypothetical protein B0A77_07055 [Flavobacterium branchiophilum]|uniref:Tetratricopeptide repeat protein n=2 Tax=Flavobacterium branchiophilum TaxID=55197 RepID=A0A2H3KYL1_9FLAO|nr:hypothetical protein B0A77_07055 [Flavobacterium branchiophilum]
MSLDKIRIMKKIICTLLFSTIGFAQSGLVKPDAIKNEPAPAFNIEEHYANVYKIASSLGDIDQQIGALINVYAASQKDESLLGLSELYINKKNYVSALICVNSVKDSTTSSVKNVKAWTYKLGGNIPKSTKYFKELMATDKDKINQNAFQVAVNDFEGNLLADAKKIIAEYKAKTKSDDMVNTTDRVSFYNVKLTAAWENLEGLILLAESSADANKMKEKKDKIVAYFDKAIALDPKFQLAIDNKTTFLKLFEPKK